MNLDGLCYRLCKATTLRETLIESDSYWALQIFTNKLQKLYNDGTIEFASYQGSFAQDVIFKILDANLGLLGCLKSGAFYASFHHLRFIMELYASIRYCFSNESEKLKRMAKYLFFREIELCKMIKRNKEGSGILLSKEITKKYENVDDSVLNIFNVTYEEIETVRKWHQEKSDESLIEMLGTGFVKHYEDFSHHAHFSSLRFRSDLPTLGFPKYWQEIPMLAFHYGICIIYSIINNDLVKENSKSTLMNCLSTISGFDQNKKILTYKTPLILKLNENFLNHDFDETLEKQLDDNSFFYRFESMLGRMYQIAEDNKINLSNTEVEIFCNDIFCKIMDEGAGFISCLKSGSLFSAFHHTRALIEIYSLVNTCFSSKASLDKYLKRYINFRKIAIYNRIQDQQNGIKDWGIGKEFIELNNDIDYVLLKKSFKTSKEDFSKIKSWTGNAKMKDFLLKFSNETHLNNYDFICCYTHPTGLRNNTIVGELTSDWEKHLFIAVKYSFDSLSHLVQTDFLNEGTREILRDVLYSIIDLFHEKSKFYMPDTMENQRHENEIRIGK